MKIPLIVLIFCMGMAGCERESASPPPSPAAPAVPGAAVASPDASPYANASTNPATRPDDSAINARDRSPDAITAGSQGQGKSDVDLTADIRRRIMGASLSINAENVKIISLNGKVTLRGPVNSQHEKDVIGQAAADAAGSDNVDNELEIAAGN